MRWLTAFLLLFSGVQGGLAVRVLRRLMAPGGSPIRAMQGEVSVGFPAGLPSGAVSVIVPVLDEAGRIGPCLDGLIAQDETVREIVVVDGGSSDGTQALVVDASQHDRRIRLVDASPAPNDWNGKAWGLQVGLEHTAPETPWILTVDADVRLRVGLARGLVARAAESGTVTASVATLQEIAGPGLGLLHPACLATLVYRLGPPGRIARWPAAVQANGQCQIFQRAALQEIGGFSSVRASRCEDVTIARALVAAGGVAGFFETDGLVSVRMYDSWRDAWNGWTRSLPLWDQYGRWSSLLGLVEVTLVQAAPLPIIVMAATVGRQPPLARPVLALNALLLLVRIGVLAGMRRAYLNCPWTYWLSPLVDFPVTVRLWTSILKRRHTWRGRSLVA